MVENKRNFPIIDKGIHCMKKQYTKKQITEAIAYWEKQLKMMNEAVHDGRNILPKHQSRRNESQKKTIYYLAVDMLDDISNYGQYIRPDGTLTNDMSNDSFKQCGVTQVPATLKKMINNALAKYGNEYHIFVYHEPYSYGYWTHKNHARPAVIDVWYPKEKYWRYDFAPIEALQEDDMLDGRPHNAHLNESDNNVYAIKTTCNSNPDFDATFIGEYAEDEMKDLGIKGQSWMSYVLDRLFIDAKGWTEDLENAFLNPAVKAMTVDIDDDIVNIQKIKN